jgi:NadR type nicotinamide-nucleotide adenylyltransferase
MIRISVTGPESTGKSWLAQRLAEHYQTDWVPEFARTYLLEINRQYTYDDILVISQNQFANENSFVDYKGPVFCDTDFCVTSIWSHVKFGKCHPWITEQLEKNRYSLYLLCNVDLPWQYDPLREHPEMRSELFGMYLNLLEKHKFNYRIVEGIGDQRLQNAINFIDKYLNLK